HLSGLSSHSSTAPILTPSPSAAAQAGARGPAQPAQASPSCACGVGKPRRRRISGRRLGWRASPAAGKGGRDEPGAVAGAVGFLHLDCAVVLQDVGLWLEEINLGSYRQSFEENGVNGEYLESLSMFTTEQILRFIRRCHMKWGDFITLCKELRRIKVACLKGEQEVRRPWWAPSCLSVVFVRVAKRNRQSRVVSLKLEA
ncbi:unnamed protein product, partial [Urochloa humidicola]